MKQIILFRHSQSLIQLDNMSNLYGVLWNCRMISFFSCDIIQQKQLIEPTGTMLLERIFLSYSDLREEIILVLAPQVSFYVIYLSRILIWLNQDKDIRLNNISIHISREINS